MIEPEHEDVFDEGYDLKFIFTRNTPQLATWKLLPV